MIHRNIKKTLDLAGMQVHCQNAVGPGATIRLATSLAVIGTRGWSLRSWRA